MRISDWSSDVCSSDLQNFTQAPAARLRCWTLCASATATANRSRRSTSSISVRPARSPKRWARPLGTSERQRGVTNSKRKGCNMQNETTKAQAQTATNPVAYLVAHGHTHERLSFSPLTGSEKAEGRSEEHTSELQSLMRI